MKEERTKHSYSKVVLHTKPDDAMDLPFADSKLALKQECQLLPNMFWCATL
jgi:hypothetical protein